MKEFNFLLKTLEIAAMSKPFPTLHEFKLLISYPNTKIEPARKL
jgi:hypothetical protein